MPYKQLSDAFISNSSYHVKEVSHLFKKI